VGGRGVVLGNSFRGVELPLLVVFAPGTLALLDILPILGAKGGIMFVSRGQHTWWVK